MGNSNPKRHGKVLYQSKATPTQPSATILVGVILAVLFAVPAISSYAKFMKQGGSTAMLLLTFAFVLMSVASILICVRLAFRERTLGVTLRNDKLICEFESSRDTVPCSDIIGAEKQSEGVALRMKSGDSVYLPEQYIGNERDVWEFMNCIDDVVQSRNERRNIPRRDTTVVG